MANMGSQPTERQTVSLLPPTPSIVNIIRHPVNSDTCLSLNLSSPDPRHQTPVTRRRADTRPEHLSTVTPVRSAPSVALTRRYVIPQSEMVPDRCNSPALKLTTRSDTECNNTTLQSQDMNMSGRTTKCSLGQETQFSPMLSSTTQAEKTFSELAEMSKHDVTSSKIEMYRKVLDGLKSKSESGDKSVLLSAWTQHRESLSPRPVTRSQHRTPVTHPVSPAPVSTLPVCLDQFDSPVTSRVKTPVCEKSPMNDLIISRLDQLMTSLTLNENPSSLNVSLSDEMDLLSPHL